MMFYKFRLLFFVCFLNVTFCYAQSAIQNAQTIALKQTIEGSIIDSVPQIYLLHLEAKQFAELNLEQNGVNAAVELKNAANGNELLTIDFNPHRFGSERIFFENGDAPRDVLVQIVAAKDSGGKFSLTLTELKKSDRFDNLRLAAQQTILDGKKIYAEENLEAKEKGRAAFEKALQIARQSGDVVLEKDILILLQESYLDELGRDKGKSAEYGKTALGKLTETENSYDSARVRLSLGSALVDMGDTSQGIEHLLKSLGLARKFGDEAMETSSLISLGLGYQRLGELDKSLWYLEQGFQIAKNSGETSEQAEALKIISRIYNARGDFPEAIKKLNDALSILGDSDENAKYTIYYDLSTNYVFLAQFQKSTDYLLKCAAYFREVTGNKWNEAATLQAISLNYLTLGQTDRASEYNRQSSEIYKKLNYRNASMNAARTQALIYRNAKDYESEKQFYLEALRLAEESGEKGVIAEVNRGLGSVEKRLGNYKPALDYYLKALQLTGQAGNKSYRAATGIFVSDLYILLEQFDKASEIAGESLTIAQSTGDRITESNALYNLARVQQSRKNLSEALRLAEASLKIVESVRADLISQESRRAYFSTVREKYDFYIQLLMELSKQTGNSENAVTAYAFSEKARARGLLDLLTESFVDVSSGINENLKAREQAIQAKLSTLQAPLIRLKSAEKPDQSRIAELQKEIDKTDDEREQLESEIRRTNPRYAALKYPTTLDLNQTQAMLDDKTVLLEYQLSKSASYLFAVSKNDFQVIALPDEQKLRESVGLLHRSISQPSRAGMANYTLKARELYKTLLAPIESSLKNKSKLIISGDGALNYLPFEVLLTSDVDTSLDKLPYLVRNYEISYTPSASVLANLNNAENAARRTDKDFLAFAAPDYGAKAIAPNAVAATRSVFGDDRAWNLSDLKNAGIEAARIAKLFPAGQSEVFTGAQASEERVKSSDLLNHYRYLHFAVHGLMDEEQPQFSSLVLSLTRTEIQPANDNAKSAIQNPKLQEDGLLQTPEIFNLKLRADLVTLSACETGLGKEMRGEGIVGLTRAFFYAGTPSVLVSLWKVDDASTADLMTYFYESLRKTDGREKAAALRQAQLKMIAGNRYAHPYYWAPFVLQGKSGTAVEKSLPTAAK